MAFASKLSQEKFNELYDQLYEKSEKAAKAAYQAKLNKAPTTKQKEACGGGYPSDWSFLFRLWCHDRVSNLHVYECLRLNHVYSPEELEEFPAA